MQALYGSCAVRFWALSEHCAFRVCAFFVQFGSGGHCTGIVKLVLVGTGIVLLGSGHRTGIVQSGFGH